MANIGRVYVRTALTNLSLAAARAPHADPLAGDGGIKGGGVHILPFCWLRVGGGDNAGATSSFVLCDRCLHT